MRCRVTIEVDALVEVESGGHEAAIRLAKNHIANGWALGFHEGADKDAGHFVIKGMSGAVKGSVPFEGNPNVAIEAAETTEEEEIF